MKFVIFENRTDIHEELSSAASDLNSIAVRRGGEAEMLRAYPQSVDSILVSLRVAERWGSRPIGLRSQVLPTAQEDQAAGWPTFVVVGLSTPRGVSIKPEDAMRKSLEEITRAVSEHNEIHLGSGICRLGVMLKDLGAESLPSSTVAAILESWLQRRS